MYITGLQATSELQNTNVGSNKSSLGNALLMFQYDLNLKDTGLKVERKMKDASVSKLPIATSEVIVGRKEAKFYAEKCTPEEHFNKEELEEFGFGNENIEMVKNEDGSVSYIIPQAVLNTDSRTPKFEVQYIKMDIKENSDGSKVVGMYPRSYTNKNQLFNNKNYFPMEYRVIKNNLCYERYYIGCNGYANKETYEFASKPTSTYPPIRYGE